MAVHLGSSSTANLVHKWEPSHAYTAGDVVMAPDGTIVSRNSDGTSGTSYTGTNWTVVAGSAAVTINGTTASTFTLTAASVGADPAGAAAAIVIPNEVEIVVYASGTGVGVTRPGAEFVVWQGFPTQPTNMADGDLWLSDLGGTFIISTVAPTSADGANGDGWLNKTTWLFYGPKASGAWPAGQSIKGADGTNGRGITSIARTSGTGAAGTTDTYTITYSDATTSTFTVVNGANGSGGGAIVEPTTAPPTTNTSGSVLGTSVNAAHADHTHAIGAHDHSTTAKGGTLPVGALSATGTPSSSTYLRGDNTWATPAGGGSSGNLPLNSRYAQPTGAIAITMDRTAAIISAQTTWVSGTLYVIGVCLTAGDVIAAYNGKTGNTGLATVTHSWAVLLDASRTVVAVSADDTTATVASNTKKAWTFGSAYTVPTSGLYYTGFMVAGGTISFQGITLGANVANEVPISAGLSSTAQTTPPSVGTTMAAITAGGLAPWAWLT